VANKRHHSPQLPAIDQLRLEFPDSVHSPINKN
jgi:hypothetical protein